MFSAAHLAGRGSPVAEYKAVNTSSFEIHVAGNVRILRLRSSDDTNRLTCAYVLALTHGIRDLATQCQPLVIAGNKRFFSAGAELSEIAALTAIEACDFAKMGQELMSLIAEFPAPVYAAIEGYCMGGGLDLALACRHRVAAPHAIFGHRGAALGLMTGWGGTQRLPRLVGKGRALEMFACAEKLHACRALAMGLIDAVVGDPVAYCVSRCRV